MPAGAPIHRWSPARPSPVPGLRRSLAAGLALSVIADWLARRPRLDPVRFGALRVADDLSYAAGVWLGCIRARTASPLVPKLVSGPGRRR